MPFEIMLTHRYPELTNSRINVDADVSRLNSFPSPFLREVNNNQDKLRVSTCKWNVDICLSFTQNKNIMCSTPIPFNIVNILQPLVQSLIKGEEV